MSDNEKAIKCIVLDAGPLILNEPSISSLLAKSEQLYSTSSVLAEIRDPTARARVQTTVIPFLNIREPSSASIKTISDFARRTGDLPVLSTTDLNVIALAYELECEKNGGDWRLRRVPGQKELNGSPPKKEQESPSAEGKTDNQTGDNEQHEQQGTDANDDTSQAQVLDSLDSLKVTENEEKTPDTAADSPIEDAPISTQEDTSLSATAHDDTEAEPEENDAASTASDSDGEWITAGNISRHLAATTSDASTTSKAPTIMQVATLTTDFALQNVLLQMNLNLLSTRLARVRHVRSHVLRCHACFATSRQLERQFCARCGQPALTRVACSTRADGGGLILHLKKNFQYNRRGDRYSIPKPVSGTSSGKGKHVKGGGKNGWGKDLILTEDQKEYVKATSGRGKGGNASGGGFLDEDYLPGILTGKKEVGRGERPKVGAGRNVNSRKR